MKRLNRRRRDPGRKAFTLLEILAVIFIIAIVMAVLLPTITRTHEPANRVKCGSNLRMIGQAIQLYANENKGNYPRVMYTRDLPPTWGTGVTAPNAFADPNRPTANDVTAGIFLLLRTQDITAEVFVCPVQNPSLDPIPDTFGGGGGANPALNRSNFTDWRKNLSYSFANAYPDEAAVKNGYKLNSTTGAEFAIAADMNPGVGDGYDVTLPINASASQAQMQKANSRNHQGSGQNVLYGDGHAEFQQNPFCGHKRDNIYTVSGSTDGSITTSRTVIGSPTWAGDSILLPVWK
jgi:prepilin-type N-terminal cleavage/methylation domain-containing protein/prepilin-type processing-associated H-X9-DG protein